MKKSPTLKILSGGFYRKRKETTKTRSPLSEESKENIRQAKLGKKLGPMSAEHKENLSNSAKGKNHTAEAKAKMSASKLGKRISPEHRQKYRRLIGAKQCHPNKS